MPLQPPGQTPTTTGPLPQLTAWRAVARCVATSAAMLVRRRVRWPRESVGLMIDFADGTTGRVYRETAVDGGIGDPCVLVVGFRLRGVHGRGHAWFRLESWLNTPFFVGFPGFVSKLWLAHDENERYRGVYEWDGPTRAEQYARSLWRVLALVSEPESIDFRILPGKRRDTLLGEQPPAPAGGTGAWWQIVSTRRGRPPERLRAPAGTTRSEGTDQ
jgi:hypothetical protein